MTEWKLAEQALSQMEVHSTADNKLVTVTGSMKGLTIAGVGTDAAVFLFDPLPGYAFKLFASEKVAKKAIEYQVYQQLGQNRHFPVCYGAGDRYLVLSYEPGITLYDCLIRGISIPRQLIADVEAARQYVRSSGLNPRDIHLKNILMQNGRAKLLDVSEYIKTGSDCRWDHLKKGYDLYYHLIDGKPVPIWLIDRIRKWYQPGDGHAPAFEEVVMRAAKLLKSRK
ncbi:serine/threonine protein kinase [Sediminibacillus dalangtanensis]|uniref:Serine/threonine protein kinase n=1 Tax=Sediminibacillus dalangtanensis TaxID=2729421 RepID=A0ABX7VN91_9BACI|nr:serine/threonine protein kinase [Sediminibacillus dalangtanensis]QTM98294.1 serine/threonine protein kinase [Sediminibacillus dalangtanensis]